MSWGLGGTLELLGKGPGGAVDSRPRRGPGCVGAYQEEGHHIARPRPLLRRGCPVTPPTAATTYPSAPTNSPYAAPHHVALVAVAQAARRKRDMEACPPTDVAKERGWLGGNDVSLVNQTPFDSGAGNGQRAANGSSARVCGGGGRHGGQPS